MAPLGIAGRNEAAAVHAALGTELPVRQGLTTYYPNLHRDWCWGDEENRASLEAVVAEPARDRRAAPSPGARCRGLPPCLRPAPAPAAVTYGCARLQSLLPAGRGPDPRGPAARVVRVPDRAALDRRPRTAAQCTRRLKPPAPGFVPVLADASAPPFLAGPLRPRADALVHRRRRRSRSRGFSRRVNALLAPGGHWINHGSLAFADAAPGRGLEPRGARGVTAVGRASRARSRARPRQPYLALAGQPACAHRVRHHVLRAQGSGTCPAPPAGRELPPWIRAGGPAGAGAAAVSCPGALDARLRVPARHDRRRAHDPRHGAAHGAAEAHAGRGRLAGDSRIPGARIPTRPTRRPQF